MKIFLLKNIEKILFARWDVDRDFFIHGPISS
jgi:hypothetical protein